MILLLIAVMLTMIAICVFVIAANIVHFNERTSKIGKDIVDLRAELIRTQGHIDVISELIKKIIKEYHI